jgi:hypothetical protein
VNIATHGSDSGDFILVVAWSSSRMPEGRGPMFLYSKDPRAVSITRP